MPNNQTPCESGWEEFRYRAGFGLRNFTRPRGTYRYLMEGCPAPDASEWIRVEWSSTEPPGTSVLLRFRTSEDGVIWGDWAGPWDQSPAVLAAPPGPVDPNPALHAQLEFELVSQTGADTPILHDFQVIWQCVTDVPVE